MTMHRPAVHRLAPVIAVALCAVLTLLAVPAFAHVSASPGQAPAGEHTVITLRVPHGCDGSPTTAISVQIPDTVASVTPQFLPGWTAGTTTGPLAEPVDLHGETVTEGVREVTWSGGTPIPDGQYFDFGLSVRTPDDVGATLYFPTVQTCESGETAWIEIPAEGDDGHDLEAPAPSVVLTAAAEPPDGHATAAASEPVAAAELTSTGQRADSGALPYAAAVVSGLALLAAVAALIIARRRTS